MDTLGCSGSQLVAQSCLTLCDPRKSSRQVPLSMAFSRQEYWSGLPFPSPEDPPDPGIKPSCPALQADSLPSELQGPSGCSGQVQTNLYRLKEEKWPNSWGWSSGGRDAWHRPARTGETQVGRQEAVPDGSWSVSKGADVGKPGSEGSLELRGDNSRDRGWLGLEMVSKGMLRNWGLLW